MVGELLSALYGSDCLATVVEDHHTPESHTPESHTPESHTPESDIPQSQDSFWKARSLVLSILPLERDWFRAALASSPELSSYSNARSLRAASAEDAGF